MPEIRYPTAQKALWVKTGGLGLLWLGLVATTLSAGPASTFPWRWFFLPLTPVTLREVWRLFRFGPRLILDDKGLFDPTLRVGTIPWTEISSASFATSGHEGFIRLALRHPDEWLAKATFPWNHWARLVQRLGGKTFCLNTMEIQADPRELLAMIQGRIQDNRPPTDSTAVGADAADLLSYKP